MTGGVPDDVDIDHCVQTYLGSRTPTARYTSFDYCHNYFRSHYEGGTVDELVTGSGLHLSCLQLGFYLASWGMLRGGTVLLNRSVRYLAPVVEQIASTPAELWDLDVHRYTPEVCQALAGHGEAIRRSMPDRATDTLITKIMLGVFGSMPAFDRQFRTGFGRVTLSTRSLSRVGDYYERNAEAIDRHRVPTLDFSTGELTDRLYTRAKVIDMIFFTAGTAR